MTESISRLHSIEIVLDRAAQLPPRRIFQRNRKRVFPKSPRFIKETKARTSSFKQFELIFPQLRQQAIYRIKLFLRPKSPSIVSIF